MPAAQPTRPELTAYYHHPRVPKPRKISTLSATTRRNIPTLSLPKHSTTFTWTRGAQGSTQSTISRPTRRPF